MSTDPTTLEIMRRELRPQERLLWAGQPRLGFVFRAIDLFLVPFSILWCGFAMYWEALALREGPFLFAIWGAAFVVIGIYFMVGRFFADFLQREWTTYGVTDERIIIVHGVVARRVKSLSLETLTDLTLTERGSGNGTITFGSGQSGFGSWGWEVWCGSASQLTPNFDLSSHARDIYELIRSAQQKAKSVRARGTLDTFRHDPGSDLVDVIDAAGRTIGTVTRREMRERRLPHRCVYILVFNARGELFIHQRTMTKDVFPGYWDVAVGGVLAAGEDFDEGACREGLEELGVVLDPQALFPFQYDDAATLVRGMVYCAVHDGPFRLQPEEIVRGEFVTLDEAWKRIEQDDFCPDGIAALREYGAREAAERSVRRLSQ